MKRFLKKCAIMLYFILLFSNLLFSFTDSKHLINNNRNEDNSLVCGTEDEIWGPILEEWITSKTSRTGRVMQLIPINNAYLTNERKDNNITLNKESKISHNSHIKITNTSNKKPSTTNNMKEVTETDLYLLGAIEKLVYRVDFMEKRLRRVEEMLYYVMAGNRVDQDPCPDNFTRITSNCYLFSSNAGREYDWKVSSKHCKKFGANLAELETIEENQDIIAYIQNNAYLRGKDFWTGGLNPGLLWIWSNSARPVKTIPLGNNNNGTSIQIDGDGRCLRLAYNPGLRSYSYKGTDCSIRYSYICELPENTSSNEIRRLGRRRKIVNE